MRLWDLTRCERSDRQTTIHTINMFITGSPEKFERMAALVQAYLLQLRSVHLRTGICRTLAYHEPENDNKVSIRQVQELFLWSLRWHRTSMDMLQDVDAMPARSASQVLASSSPPACESRETLSFPDGIICFELLSISCLQIAEHAHDR